MRKIIIVGAAVLTALTAYLFYFQTTHTSLLELLNLFNPPSSEPQGLIPQEQLDRVEQEITVNGIKRTLKIPAGYRIEVFAEGFTRPRLLAFDPGSGDLYVTETGTGKVWNVTKREVVVEGIKNVHGISFSEGDLYLASTTSVFRYRNGNLETMVDDLPSGGHYTATIAFGPDGKLYVSRGSSCNACENEVRRGAPPRFYKGRGGGGGNASATTCLPRKSTSSRKERTTVGPTATAGMFPIRISGALRSAPTKNLPISRCRPTPLRSGCASTRVPGIFTSLSTVPGTGTPQPGTRWFGSPTQPVSQKSPITSAVGW